MSNTLAQLQSILESAVASEAELGCQCAFWSEETGELSLASGWLDANRTRQVATDSLFPVFSTGKTIATTAALRVIDRGLISLDTHVVDLWPEFAGLGREQVTMQDVLAHTTGLFCMPHADTPEELADWPLMCSRLAAMRPAWMPGTRTKYQAFTYSWLLGEPLRRLTGKAFQEVLVDEVLAPLGMTSGCYFGLPESQLPRLAELQRASDLLPPLPPKPTFWNPTENLVNQPVIRQACLPAFNGIANAHALLQLGKALLDSSQPFLSQELLKDATSLHRPPDQEIPSNPGYWELFGLGYLLYANPPGRGRIFGHGGYGGSELLIDQQNRTVFAFTKNRLSTDQTTRESLKTALRFG
ncbi:MAG: beta-lactamase family protein [Victivallales bacterium]|nr:beta-lactamase family protein [Victivallales bacterium]